MEKEINVIISETALQQMCFGALEAYSVKKLGMPKGGNKYLEAYGLLWGSYTSLELKKYKQAFYHIEFMTIDVSAEQKKGAIYRNEDSLIIKRDLAASYWPHMRFLGDFHTHPYKNSERNAIQIEKEKLYEFSDDDIRDIENNAAFWRKHRYKVGLVFTVVNLAREARTDKRINNSTLVAGFGNYKVWIKAYYAKYKDGGKIEMSDDLFLECHSLIGMVKYNSFGRHVSGRHRAGDL